MIESHALCKIFYAVKEASSIAFAEGKFLKIVHCLPVECRQISVIETCHGRVTNVEQLAVPSSPCMVRFIKAKALARHPSYFHWIVHGYVKLKSVFLEPCVNLPVNVGDPHLKVAGKRAFCLL